MTVSPRECGHPGLADDGGVDPFGEKALVEDVYECTAPRLTREFASFTRDLIGAGEAVVALDTLCDYLLDLVIELPLEDAVAIADAAEALGTDRHSRARSRRSAGSRTSDGSGSTVTADRMMPSDEVILATLGVELGPMDEYGARRLVIDGTAGDDSVVVTVELGLGCVSVDVRHGSRSVAFLMRYDATLMSVDWVDRAPYVAFEFATQGRRESLVVRGGAHVSVTDHVLP